QYASWNGGLKPLAETLIKNYPHGIGTPEMLKLEKRTGQKYDSEQVRQIRKELPEEFRKKFLLRGETLGAVCRVSMQAEHARRLEALYCDAIAQEDQSQAEADSRPKSYPVDDFVSLCTSAAHEQLENFLRDLCLDAAIKVKNAAPWYFAGIVDAL